MKSYVFFYPYRVSSEDEIYLSIKLANKFYPNSEFYIYGDKIDLSRFAQQSEEFSVSHNIEQDDTEKSLIDRIHNVYVEPLYNKWLDVNHSIEKFINEVGEPFVLMNDDFFIVEPNVDLEVTYVGDLETRMDATIVIDKATNTMRYSAYGLNLKAYRDFCGNGDVLHSEFHMPLYVADPMTMLFAIKDCNNYYFPALRRTYYVSLMSKCHGLETIFRQFDVKYAEPYHKITDHFFSTDDVSYNYFKDDLLKVLES